MKIQISGLNGFVGRNLSLYLSNDGKLQLNALNLRNVTFNDISINGDAIIHLAGKAHDLKNVSVPEEYYQVNYELTRQLYDAFLQSEATKFIFISSVKSVADSVEGVLTETELPIPQSHYGKSKLMAEEYIQSQPLPEGKSYYILRPCMIHGPGNKGNLNLLYRLVAKGIPYPLASFENKRSFLSVENLCFVIHEIIKRQDFPIGVYNIADDDAISTNQLIKLLSQALNKSPQLWHLPQSIIKFLATVGDKLHLPLTTERLHKLTENYVVSNHKIKFALGKELPLSATEGILRTARTFNNA